VSGMRILSGREPAQAPVHGQQGTGDRVPEGRHRAGCGHRRAPLIAAAGPLMFAAIAVENATGYALGPATTETHGIAGWIRATCRWKKTRRWARLQPAMPWVSVVAIAAVVAAVASKSQPLIATAGPLMFAAIALENATGYALAGGRRHCRPGPPPPAAARSARSTAPSRAWPGSSERCGGSQSWPSLRWWQR